MVLVESLFIYPLKSGRAIPMARVSIDATGFKWDRYWMAVDAAGHFITQRTHPKLALVVPDIGEDALTLNAPGQGALHIPLRPEGASATVKVWRDTCTGLDQGEAAAEWISAAIGDHARLVRMPPAMDRKASASFAGTVPAPMSYADGFPILVTNSASLVDLNTRMAEPLPMSRFRANVVVSGLPAWAEDGIARLASDGVSLDLVKPCTRCVITSTDQETGERSTNPLPVLRKFRWNKALLGVLFGENAVISAGVGGSLERGAALTVTYK